LGLALNTGRSIKMRSKLRFITGFSIAAMLALSTSAYAGEITAYTSLEEDDAKVYLEDFAEEAPDIKVNMLRLSTGDLGARILAEKSNPQHDVIWGWAVTQMVDPRILEMIEPYKPKGIESVNTSFKDPQDRWFATTGYFAAFCVNTEVLKEKNLPMPSSWQDLLNPVYKDQLIMPNPASSGTGYLQISSILQMKGEEEGWKFLHELDKNMGQYIKSGSKPCKLTRVGEYAVGASFAFVGVKSIQDGYPIKIVIPSEGAGYEMEVSALMKTSKNKGDAQRFLDWLLCPWCLGRCRPRTRVRPACRRMCRPCSTIWISTGRPRTSLGSSRNGRPRSSVRILYPARG
jgi:iron(III) transport system substrate-binding protein